MRKLPLILVAIGIAVVLFIGALDRKSESSGNLDRLNERYPQKHIPSTDHSKLPALQKKFASAQEVTRACLSCHTESAGEVMRSSHWNWEREEYIPHRGVRSIGKKNILNNFCIGISSNQESCNVCHIGYGWKDADFDFSKAENIDCLACHDNSNTYVKAFHGLPDTSVNLTEVAQQVGRPLRTNCGACHFFGGGGNNVKHGDLEKSLFDAGRDVDVHMGLDGADMQCVDCHTAKNHQMLGKMYSVSSMNRNRSHCEQCHSDHPHADEILDRHTYKVACQTCHIPEYAKVNSTKMSWDWSTAGRLRNGEPYEKNDSLGNHTYLSIKGSFTWGRNVKPEYVWFNGTASHYLIGDTVSNGPVQINQFSGSYNDPDSKIIPVKIHRTKQPYDPVNKILIQPKLFSSRKGEGAFWKDFDWKRSAEEGMKTVHLPFSGKYSFIETEMTWPVNHMVSPKSKTLSCSECHKRKESRLAGMRDFYLPGRDFQPLVEYTGIILLILTLMSIAGHASARIIVKRKLKEGKA
jgi:octaheme c-type cytochrome (tetrathionate reductase family)